MEDALMQRPDASEDEIIPQEGPVALPLPLSRRRQCTGARLGNKRYEVEQMLLEGQPKVKIARALKISAHSVRAVAQQLGEERYAALSGDAPTAGNSEPTRKSLSETLKTKAIQAVDAITPDKLEKATPQACAMVADRLLGRADALEKQGHDMNFLANLITNFGLAPSHSASRVTLEQKVTIETQHKLESQQEGSGRAARFANTAGPETIGPEVLSSVQSQLPTEE
jgi:hypothetical protein